MIKQASIELGVDFYQLFTAMIVNRTFDDVMDKKNKTKMKARLGDQIGKEHDEKLQAEALMYHKDIVAILAECTRELLLLMKTNNYLRAIDRRLGNPNNTFNVINEYTWDTFRKEMSSSMSTWAFTKELMRYYFLRMALYAIYINLRFRTMLGLSVDAQQLEDFELDVTHREDLLKGDPSKDSLMGLAVVLAQPKVAL